MSVHATLVRIRSTSASVTPHRALFLDYNVLYFEHTAIVASELSFVSVQFKFTCPFLNSFCETKIIDMIDMLLVWTREANLCQK